MGARKRTWMIVLRPIDALAWSDTRYRTDCNEAEESQYVLLKYLVVYKGRIMPNPYKIRVFRGV